VLSPSKIVLGLDMGFAQIGWCVMCWHAGKWTVLAMGVISTEETAAVHKKQKHLRVSASVMVRCAEALSELSGIISMWRPCIVCYEDTMWVRSTKTMFRVGGIYGGLAHMLFNATPLPSIPVQPMEAKQAVCGKAATKQERKKQDVIKAVQKLYPECKAHTKGFLAKHMPHPHDAVAIVVACFNDPIFKLTVGV
jgi:Holliday junction resolvasome RuvABC endonuclease subunit